MKKVLFFITTLVIASIFTGCKEEEKGNPEALIGTWKYESATGTINGQTIPVDEESNEQITFYSNGTVESTEDGAGTYTTKGYSITMTFTDKETGKPIVLGPGQSVEFGPEDTGLDFGVIANIESQTYSVQGNKLTIKNKISATVLGQKMVITSIVVYKKI